MITFADLLEHIKEATATLADEIIIGEINDNSQWRLSEYQTPDEIEGLDELPLMRVRQVDY